MIKKRANTLHNTKTNKNPERDEGSALVFSRACLLQVRSREHIRALWTELKTND